MDTNAHQIRELFIEELEQVHGGIPLEELLRRIAGGIPPTETTLACCEEGSENCC